MSNLNEEQQKEINKIRQRLAIRETYWKSAEGRRAYIRHYINDNFGIDGFYTKLSRLEVQDGKKT